MLFEQLVQYRHAFNGQPARTFRLAYTMSMNAARSRGDPPPAVLSTDLDHAGRADDRLEETMITSGLAGQMKTVNSALSNGFKRPRTLSARRSRPSGSPAMLSQTSPISSHEMPVATALLISAKLSGVRQRFKKHVQGRVRARLRNVTVKNLMRLRPRQRPHRNTPAASRASDNDVAAWTAER